MGVLKNRRTKDLQLPSSVTKSQINHDVYTDASPIITESSFLKKFNKK